MASLLIFILSALLLISNTSDVHASQHTTRNIKEMFLPDQVLVKFRDDVPDYARERIHESCGARTFRRAYGDRYHVATIRDGAVEETIAAYTDNSEVEYAEPNYIIRAFTTPTPSTTPITGADNGFRPDDEFFHLQWNLSQIDCEDAWTISTGAGITVAVIDTGVNPNGFDGFGKNLAQGRNFLRLGRFFRDATDDNGHGTHVAGTIAQATNNITGVAGVAFDATIMPVKVLGRFGFGNTNSVVDGIRWAADNGADIINLSLGGAEGSTSMEDVINEVHEMGVVVIAAAGNESSSVSFPAAYETVIAVGSVRSDKELSFFSNFGAEIDVVAPGGDMNVDQNSDGFPDGILQETFVTGFLRRRNEFNFDLFFFQGTSQASPHVAGVAALILSKNPTLTPDEVREIITNTAEDLGEEGRDDDFGHGLINAAAALR